MPRTGNPDNLKKHMENITPEELRKQNSKAGKASGKARRERKAFREQLLMALQTINPATGNTFNEDIVANLIYEALNGKNSVNAFTTIRDSVGEKPKDEVSLSTGDTIEIKIGGDSGKH